MGIAKSQFTDILKNIFTAGNVIKLYTTVPDEDTEENGEFVKGASYLDYTILSGDFSVSDGVVTSLRNVMLYLCEETAGHGTAEGFGVFTSSGALRYFGAFTEPMEIGYNTVPTIKKYNASMREGIKITLTSTNVSG